MNPIFRWKRRNRKRPGNFGNFIFTAPTGFSPETVHETVARSDRASVQLIEAVAPTVREVVARSDRASVQLFGSIAATVRETVSRSDRATASLLESFEVTARDTRLVSDRAFSVVQEPFSDQMVILTHIHNYFQDGSFGWSSTHVNGSHNHPGKVLLWGGSEREIPVPPTGPPRISDMVVEFDDTDQYFRKTFGARTPKYRKVDFRIGPAGGVESAFQTPASGLIVDVKFPPGKMRLYIKDFRDKWLHNLIPPFFNEEIFPNLPVGVRDGFSPFVFGIVSSVGFGDQGAIRLQHVDTGNHRYIVARHPVEAVTIYRKAINETEFSVVESGWELIVEEITINGFLYHFSYVQFDGDQGGAEIRADVDGLNFYGSWGLFPGHTGVSRNVIDHVFSFLYAVERVEQVQLNYDIYAFKNVRDELEAREWKHDQAFTEQITNEAALTRMFGSNMVHWFPNRRDQFMVKMTPEEAPEGAPRFGDAFHILRESEMPELAQETKNRIFYDFAPIDGGGLAGHGVYNNVADQAALLDDEGNTIYEDETITLYGVRDLDTAEAVATEWGVWRDQDAHRFRMELDMPTNIVQDRVELAIDALITHYGGLVDGGWIRERFFFYRIRDEFDRLRFIVDAIRRPAVPGILDQVVDIGRWSWNHLPGPWYVTTNKQVFEVYVDNRAGLKKMVMLGTDDDGLQVPVDDGAYPMLDNIIVSSEAKRYGNKVYVAHQEENTGRVAGSIFDLLLREWILLNFEFIASNSDGDCGVSVVVRQPSGQFGILYQGDRGEGTGNMGSAGPGFYMRAKFKYIDDNGDLSSEFEIGAPYSHFANLWFPIWGDPDYLGKVHIHVGRAIAEENNQVRFMLSGTEPGDVASTDDLYTQLLSGSDVLTPTHERMTIAGQFPANFSYGDPTTFEHDGTFYTAVVVGIQNEPRLWIYESTSAVGEPDVDIPLGATIDAETSPDTFGTKSVPGGVRYHNGNLYVIIGTRSPGEDDWAVMKVLEPPFTELSPAPATRQDQIGPTWPTNNYARQGWDIATIRGKRTVFKSTSGNLGLPSLEGYRILEKIDVAADVPGDNDFTIADFIEENT